MLDSQTPASRFKSWGWQGATSAPLCRCGQAKLLLLLTLLLAALLAPLVGYQDLRSTPKPLPGLCQDGDCPSALDAHGYACHGYTIEPGRCEKAYDDDDFTARHMCCACGGGRSLGQAVDLASTAREVTGWGDVMVRARPHYHHGSARELAITGLFSGRVDPPPPPPPAPRPQVYAALVRDEDEMLRALMIAAVLKKHKSRHRFVALAHTAMVDPDVLGKYDRAAVRSAFNFEVVRLAEAYPLDWVVLLARGPPAGVEPEGWEKLGLHSLHARFEKIVVLDSDTLLQTHLDEIFTLHTDGFTAKTDGPTATNARGAVLRMLELRGIDAGMMLIIPSEVAAAAMKQWIPTFSMALSSALSYSYADYFRTLWLESYGEPPTRPRRTALLLAPVYCLNVVFCMETKYVKMYRFVDRKPWKTTTEQYPRCEHNVRLQWQALQTETSRALVALDAIDTGSSSSTPTLGTPNVGLRRGRPDGSTEKPRAYASFILREADLLRALVIGHNLKKLGSAHGFVILHNGLNLALIRKYDHPELRARFGFEFCSFAADLDPAFMIPPDKMLRGRVWHWKAAWSKVAVHSLYASHSKIILLDIDTLMIQHLDELFGLELDALTPEFEGGTNQGLWLPAMRNINSGFVFAVPSEAAMLRMKEFIEFQSPRWPPNANRISDQSYFQELMAEPAGDDTVRPRVDSVLLAPMYNSNTAFCDRVRYTRNHHFYHHKPWKREDQHRREPAECALRAIRAWNDLYDEMVPVYAELDIQLPPYNVTRLLSAGEGSEGNLPFGEGMPNQLAWQAAMETSYTKTRELAAEKKKRTSRTA